MEEEKNPLIDGLFANDRINITDKSEVKETGKITDQDRLIAAKQILAGIAILFIITIGAYLLKPQQGTVLLEICKTVFPPLATLIIAFYFKDKN
jgi:hypothetical protein